MSSTKCTGTNQVLRERVRVLILEHRALDWVAAEGGHVRVHSVGRGHLFRHAISALEERLDPVKCTHIHRSA